MSQDTHLQIVRLWMLNALAAVVSFELKDVQTILSISLIVLSIIYTTIKIVKEFKNEKNPKSN